MNLTLYNRNALESKGVPIHLYFNNSFFLLFVFKEDNRDQIPFERIYIQDYSKNLQSTDWFYSCQVTLLRSQYNIKNFLVFQTRSKQFQQQLLYSNPLQEFKELYKELYE